MEQRIVINGKMYIVPAGRVSSLIAWLETNAVDASRTQPIREVAPDERHSDQRDLLLETR